MTIDTLCALEFYNGATNELELTVTDRDDAVVTDATVTIETIVDEDGTELPSPISFPISAAHVAAGVYRGEIADTADWGFRAFADSKPQTRVWWAHVKIVFFGGSPILPGRVQLNVRWWSGKTIT